MPRQTYFAKTGEISNDWHQVDADGEILGRLAVRIARVLMGKHKPEYTPHVDTGDYVIVTNAEKIQMTGRKLEQRFKTSWSGYPGGLRKRSFGEILEKFPERLVEDAVRRMLPKGRLGRQMYKKLKVYSGTEHPHSAQNPSDLPI